MKRFISADWHLGEDRFALMQRPFKNKMEMIESLIEKHNSLVNTDDVFYMVGDVCYQKSPEMLKYVGDFNGRKILIRGNHDRVFTDEQLLQYFEKVIPEGDGIDLEIEDIPVYLTHYPTQAKLERFNLVGHIHSAWKFQLNMMNVGVDVNHFVPLNLDVIVPFAFKAISEFYDQDVWVAYQDVNSVWKEKRGKKDSYFKKDAK